MISRTRSALRTCRRVLLQAPTGAGKTVLASFMMSGTVRRSESAWFICHRAELVDGTSKTLTKFGIPHGIIASGIRGDLRQLVQVCSIDTLKGRLATLQAPKIAIIDEAHHSGAAGWKKVIDWLTEQGTLIIGLSATPERLDGRGLDDLFDDLVPGPQVAWLMEHGHLSDYVYLAPPPPSGLKAKGADDGRTQQAKVMNTPKLTGDIVAHWLAHAKGKRTVGFACNKKHSRDMVDAFNAAGIPAAHLDGDTPRAERREIIRQFACGEILVLWNVSLFGEGFDLAAIAQMDVTIDCVILARKTQSLALFLQMIGRALRPQPGKVAVILDHAGNLTVHGFPDDERDWKLEGAEARKAAANDNSPPPPVICSTIAKDRALGVGCYNALRRPLPTHCPHCKAELDGGVMAAKEIEVAEGRLEIQTKEHKAQVRKQLAWEMQQAKTLGELVALGQRRGYKSPMTWAQKVFAGRKRA